MRVLSRYGRDFPRLLTPPVQPPEALPPPIDAALRHVDDTRAALGEASAQHRAALALLAAELRSTASDLLGSVDALCELVEERTALAGEDKRVPARTVRNALYERFVAEHLTACVEALAAVATSSGLPQAA